MATIKSFEEIDAWKGARELARKIYELGNKGRFAKDLDFRSQICRSAVSVMSNIAEGFESQTPGTFIRYLNIAKGSAGELRSQLCIARDIEYISNTNFYSLCEQCRKISSQIAKLIQYLKKRQT